MRTIAIALLLLTLAGCGQEPTPAPTPTGYTLGTIVDQESFNALKLLVDTKAYEVVYTVCNAKAMPEELAQHTTTDSATIAIRLAVEAGCPERRDW